MDPVINSYDPDDLYETGPIIINGSGFNSLDTRLLIDGISSIIRKITDTSISATIPIVNNSGVYDVRVLTYSKYDGLIYSDPIFVYIKKIENPKIRFPPIINPDDSRVVNQESKANVDNDSSSSDSSTSVSSISSESSSSESSISTSSSSQAITSGSYTVGVGGDFINWSTAFADVDAPLTGDLTFTQISDTTDTSAALISGIDTGSHTLTITNNLPHNGSTTGGYATKFDFSSPNPGISISGLNMNIDINNLRFEVVDGSSVTDTLFIDSSTGTININNCIFNGNDIGQRGLYIGKFSGTTTEAPIYNIWNCIFAGFDVFSYESIRLQTVANSYGEFNIENCIIHRSSGDVRGMRVSGFAFVDLIFIRNTVEFGGGSAVPPPFGLPCSLGSVDKDYCAHETSAADLPSCSNNGPNDIFGIDPSDAFISTTYGDVNYLVPKSDSILINNGSASPLIALNTSDIAGNSRPVDKIDIGVFESTNDISSSSSSISSESSADSSSSSFPA